MKLVWMDFDGGLFVWQYLQCFRARVAHLWQEKIKFFLKSLAVLAVQAYEDAPRRIRCIELAMQKGLS